ncbi:MAG: TlpA disulfide reductase family protein [Bacteroidota bacterium]|nr:TlpA disulfide reductase family protein [Bacteroidota bacterium]
MRNIKLYQKVLFFLLLTTSNALAIDNQYNINGSAEASLNGKKVMLFKFRGEHVSHVDTTIVRNGSFCFQGRVDTAIFAVLTCGNYPDTVRAAKLMIEPGQINILLQKRSHIGGTLLNNIFQSYIEKHAILEDSIGRMADQPTSDSLSLALKNNNLKQLYNRLKEQELDFIRNNSGNMLGLILFREKCLHADPNMFFEIYNPCDSLSKNDPYIKRCTYWYETEAKEDRERLANREKLQGQPYKNLTLLTTTGQKANLSEFISNQKYTLVVFWASWCSPCMAEQPTIKDIYDRYKEKGLEVIGISLDSDDAAWKLAINKIKSTWTQLRDIDTGNTGVKNLYGINAIPFNILIDRTGKIVSSGIPAVVLPQYVKSLLDTPKIF